MCQGALVIDPVVTHSWLPVHADDVVLVDVRFYLNGSSGRAAYEAGHLPGARFVDFDPYFSDGADPSRGRNQLPSPAG